MKDIPLKIFDISVISKWDIEKAVEYQRNIDNIIRFAEMKGKPLTIEYMDDDLNIISTLKFKGDEKRFLEHETRMKKLLKGEIS
tara:strand:- start:555 stop:806 length:252 start_codon:yes stop_codon:yes gene_type:complete